jgi:glycosyltransferase involved in cell wall biosynthesis
MSDFPKAWLFVLPWDISYPGGVNQVVSNLINTQQKTETIKPKLIIDQHCSAITSIGNTSIDYLLLTNPCWSSGILGPVKYLLKLPFLFLRLRRYIGTDIKCINPHYPSLNILNFVLYKQIGFYKGKIILSFHGTDIVSIKKTSGLEKLLWHFIFTHVDFMVCCSQKLADELIEYIDNSTITYKIKVIHNGIDEQIMNNSLANPDALPSEIRNSCFILNVATFEHKKGQDILIRAFAKIKSSNPVKLVLIGRSSDALVKYQQLARQLECENDVIFIENLDHQAVLSFFQRADIFCLPSRYEPFGIVLLEAGFFSCPVIASNVGGIPEIIEDGYDGCLVQPENVDELSNKLDDFLNNSEMAQQMGERLKNKVINTYTWDIASSKYLSLLH